MMASENPVPPVEVAGSERRPLSPAALRALAEAEARRAQAKAEQEAGVSDDGGPTGPEPTRFGDWERKGIAVDF